MQAAVPTYTNSEDATEEGSVRMSPTRQHIASLTSKMRQRRMRRMKERENNASLSSFASAEREDESAKNHVEEHYKQPKSSPVRIGVDPPATAAVVGLDPPVVSSSIANAPAPPPRLLKKRVPNSIFTVSDDPPPPTPQEATVPKNIIDTKKKNKLQVAFNEEEFFPNLQSGLSEDEVRDAANYTSIQFNCNFTSGEVEVFDENNSSGLLDDDANHHGEEGIIDSWKNEVWSSDSNAPNTRNNEEQFSSDLFRLKEAANMISFLTPNRLSRAGLMSPEVNQTEEDDTPPDVRGDSPRGISSPDAPGLSYVDNPGSSRGGEWRGTQLFHQDDIDEDVRQSMVTQALRKQMVKPSPQMEELLKQIHRDFFTQIDRTFATRRKNACGALKILAAKEENRLKICWSSGVLTAISSVLQDVHAVIEDEQTRLANAEARNRIVSALLNLSVNKKNRLLIVNTPGLLESIAQTILHDQGEGRQGCCTVLLYLSKTRETRSAIAKSIGLMDAIAKVIEVPTWNASQQPQVPDVCKKKCDMDRMDTHEDMSCTSSSEHSHHSEYSHKNMKEGVDGTEGIQERTKSLSFTLSYEKVVDTSDPVEIDYDLDPNKFLHGARLAAFACLLCLVKSKETVAFIANEDAIVESLIGVSRKFSSPSHARALAILAHLTRHPQNCHLLVFKYLSLLPLLQEATSSPDKEGRRYALCALQNLSIDTSCRAPVAHTPNMIKSLTNRLKHSGSEGELVAAVATLQNLADEPANLIQFTIVKNCVASIIEVARSDDNGKKETDVAAFLAKNTLVTLSHWFRRIATSGSERIVSGSGGRAPHILHNAVLRPTTYQQWS